MTIHMMKKFEMSNFKTSCVDLDDLNNNAACEAGSFGTIDRPIHAPLF